MNTSRNKILSPLVSIIVPLYNQELFIQKCLSSLTGQSYDNLEIIVINDGSADSSLLLAQECAQEDSRIKLISQENAGVSSARNKGLELATGQLVMFVDADDWLEPSCVAEVVEAWLDASRETENAVAIRFGHLRGTEPIVPEERLMSGRESFIHLLREYDVCASSIWALLIPRSFINEHTLTFNNEINRSEDVLFLAELYKCGCSVTHYAEALYNYRIGDGLGSQLYPHALAKADLFYRTLKDDSSTGSPLDELENEALVHYMARFYILSMCIEANQTKNRRGTVERALELPTLLRVMKQAAALKDLPPWARIIAKSIMRNNKRAVSFYLAAIEKSLLA